MYNCTTFKFKAAACVGGYSLSILCMYGSYAPAQTVQTSMSVQMMVVAVSTTASIWLVPLFVLVDLGTLLRWTASAVLVCAHNYTSVLAIGCKI